MTRDRDDFERETDTAQALGASVRGLEVRPFAQVRVCAQRGGISSALFFPAAAVLLIAALVVGTSIGARRVELSQVAASPSLRPSLPAVVTSDQAIAFVRGLQGEVLRVDRIEAKLVTWREFAPLAMGVDRTGGKTPIPDAVWAVAVAGDTYPAYWDAPLGTPRQHFVWSLWGIDASRLNVVSLKVGDTGNWPPGFDAIVGSTAVAPTPTPTPPVPPAFDHFPSALQQPLPRLQDVAASDADALRLWAIASASTAATSSALVRSDDSGRNWRGVVSPAKEPAYVAAIGSVVLVADRFAEVGSSGGLYLSTDNGTSWKRVAGESVGLVRALQYQGRPLFLAEHPWVTQGAASGSSRIFASTDGETWRQIGEVPGPASFGMLDVPLVSYSKNTPGDGIYRIEGASLSDLRLVPLPGSLQVSSFTLGPRNELWSFSANGVPRASLSVDGGRTWRAADVGLAGRLAGLFVANGNVYAIGDGAYYWDGSEWRVANIVTGKANAVFQLGTRVLIQDLPGSLWRSR